MKYTGKKNIKCPICGKYTFAEEEDYDICPVCGWENEICEDDYESGANHMTPNQAREYYKRFGHCKDWMPKYRAKEASKNHDE